MWWGSLRYLWLLSIAYWMLKSMAYRERVGSIWVTCPWNLSHVFDLDCYFFYNTILWNVLFFNLEVVNNAKVVVYRILYYYYPVLMGMNKMCYSIIIIFLFYFYIESYLAISSYLATLQPVHQCLATVLG